MSGPITPNMSQRLNETSTSSWPGESAMKYRCSLVPTTTRTNGNRTLPTCRRTKGEGGLIVDGFGEGASKIACPATKFTPLIMRIARSCHLEFIGRQGRAPAPTTRAFSPYYVRVHEPRMEAGALQGPIGEAMDCRDCRMSPRRMPCGSSVLSAVSIAQVGEFSSSAGGRVSSPVGCPRNLSTQTMKTTPRT